MCPVRDIVTTLEGGQVQLEVYVASYPLLTGNQIHWYTLATITPQSNLSLPLAFVS